MRAPWWNGCAVCPEQLQHEKPNITFGVYSGGNSLKTIAEAIEHVRYPLGRVKLT
jgi:hypothetical protein